jgi:WD40 repeat protein
MCVACHPEEPAFIAAGSFNGEVYVWNTAAEEQLVACTQIDDYFHREPISKVQWVYNMEKREYEVVSISGDGNVLFWSLRTQPPLAYPTRGFRCVKKSGGGSKKKTDVIGGTAMSFAGAGRMSSAFIVGSEAGAVYRSSLNKKQGAKMVTDSSLKWTAEAETALQSVPGKEKLAVVKKIERFAKEEGHRNVTVGVVFGSKPDACSLFPSPTEFAFQAHTGPVHALDASPFHRNLFLSASADGDLRVSSMLQAKPLMVLQVRGRAGGRAGGRLVGRGGGKAWRWEGVWACVGVWARVGVWWVYGRAAGKGGRLWARTVHRVHPSPRHAPNVSCRRKLTTLPVAACMRLRAFLRVL